MKVSFQKVLTRCRLAWHIINLKLKWWSWRVYIIYWKLICNSYNTSHYLQNLFSSTNRRKSNIQVKRMQPISYSSAIKDPVRNKCSSLSVRCYSTQEFQFYRRLFVCNLYTFHENLCGGLENLGAIHFKTDLLYL